MRLSRKVTGEFVGVFLIGSLVGGMAMWDWAAVKENTLIGLATKAAASDTKDVTLQKEETLSADAKLAQFLNRTNDPDKMIARINEKYLNDDHLTPDELNRIQPLIKEMAENVSQTRQTFGHDILATVTLYHQKIAMQLTPEHRAAYENASTEREKQISSLLLPDQSPPPQGQK